MADTTKHCLHTEIIPEAVTSSIKHSLLQKMVMQYSNKGSVVEFLRESLQDGPLKTKIRNAVYSAMLKESCENTLTPKSSAEDSVKEKVLVFLESGLLERLSEDLKAMAATASKPMVETRSPADSQLIARSWDSLKELHNTKVLCKVDALYAAEDIYQCVVGPKSQCHPAPLLESFLSISVDLKPPRLYNLRQKYQELHPSYCQMDSVVPVHILPGISQRVGQQAVQAINSGLHPLGREVCKYGCPASVRFRLWCMALGIDPKTANLKKHFEALKDQVIEKAHFLDNFLFVDINLCISDDDEYFVFEDMVYQLALAFLRDLPSLGGVHDQFIPCHGFSYLIAPFCYLHLEINKIYPLFVETYCRLLWRLHNITGHSDGITRLSATFEVLLHERAPSLVFHFATHQIDALSLVFKWMVFAFSGYLDADQVLYLWDRMIAFDSLLILPVAAVGILEFRASNLMQVTTKSGAEAVLSDLHQINILPLIQAVLFL